MYEEYKQYPDFSLGAVPVPVAAKVIGMDKDILRRAMKNKEIDLGVVRPCVKKRGRRRYSNFYISPKKLYELTGYIWKGEKTVEELKQRYSKADNHENNYRT